MKAKEKFDWPKAVRRLERSGMTLRSIADDVGAGSAQLISEIKRGKTQEPKGMVAVRLYDLHEKTFRVIKARKAVTAGLRQKFDRLERAAGV